MYVIHCLEPCQLICHKHTRSVCVIHFIHECWVRVIHVMHHTYPYAWSLVHTHTTNMNAECAWYTSYTHAECVSYKLYVIRLLCHELRCHMHVLWDSFVTNMCHTTLYTHYTHYTSYDSYVTYSDTWHISLCLPTSMLASVPTSIMRITLQFHVYVYIWFPKTHSLFNKDCDALWKKLCQKREMLFF